MQLTKYLEAFPSKYHFSENMNIVYNYSIKILHLIFILKFLLYLKKNCDTKSEKNTCYKIVINDFLFKSFKLRKERNIKWLSN